VNVLTGAKRGRHSRQGSRSEKFQLQARQKTDCESLSAKHVWDGPAAVFNLELVAAKPLTVYWGAFREAPMKFRDSRDSANLFSQRHFFCKNNLQTHCGF